MTTKYKKDICVYICVCVCVCVCINTYRYVSTATRKFF